MVVLITGGAGYIGYEFVRSLHFRSDISEIRVYDNLSRTSHHFFMGSPYLRKLRFIKADILDTYALEKALKGVDVVYHFAAFVSQPYNHLQNLQYEQINRWGTLNLARAVKASSSVKKLIYLSSTAVYGFGDISSSKQDPLPTNAYGESKYHGEEYINQIHTACETYILRSANVFGYNPCARLDSVINAWVFSALTEGNISIYGSGEQKRAFVPMHHLIEDLLTYARPNPEREPKDVSILFCASLNQIKDWLTEALPHLEFTHLNRNQKFPSQDFTTFPLLDVHKNVLNEHLSDMKEKVIINTAEGSSE
jgi:UDP-glucose 4-epimerase